MVLGDVSGKGASAAVVTALARYIVRAGIHHDRSPASVLRLLHEEICKSYPDRFCTVLLLDISQALRSCNPGFSWTQLPIHTDGTTTSRVGSHGSILGMIDSAKVEDHHLMLHPGDALILYTDGVSEGRSEEGQFFGDDRVEVLAASHVCQPASMIAAAIVDAAVEFQGNATRDDIAAVVIRLAFSPADR